MTSFHYAARGVDKPAEDCELEPNNQSAVVSIVMLSPIGRGKNGKGTHDMAARQSRLSWRHHTDKHTPGDPSLSRMHLSVDVTGEMLLITLAARLRH